MRGWEDWGWGPPTCKVGPGHIRKTSTQTDPCNVHPNPSHADARERGREEEGGRRIREREQ